MRAASRAMGRSRAWSSPASPRRGGDASRVPDGSRVTPRRVVVDACATPWPWCATPLRRHGNSGHSYRRRLGPAVPHRPSPWTCRHGTSRFGEPQIDCTTSGTSAFTAAWPRASGAPRAPRWRRPISKSSPSCCPRAPARVLDVPCGDGRIALPLERAGYDVTGVDIERQDPRFVQGDLRALPDLGAFDAVLSWGNSFGYTTPPETQQALNGFKAALQPGRAADPRVADRGGGASSTKTFSEQASYTFGGITMTATNTYNPLKSRLESDWRFTDRRQRGARERRPPRPHDGRGGADARGRRVHGDRPQRARRRPLRTRSATTG